MKIGRKITFEETYFDGYNNPDVLYWIGFIAADGNVMNKRESRSYFLTINLKVDDFSHLDKFKNALKSNVKITKHVSKGGFRANKQWKDSETCRIVLNSKYLVNSLEKFNIVPAKSHIYDFPIILYNNDNINSFIRGYFDGDGCVSFRKNRLRLNFYGTSNFLVKIGEIIAENCNISMHRPFKNRTIYNLEYNGKEAVILVKWLYQNVNEKTILNRKYELIKDIL